MNERMFPLVEATTSVKSDALPMAKEWAWNFEEDKPIFRGGSPVQVTGSEAVKVWAFNALHSVRYEHEMWTPNYGCELDRLIGQSFTQETKLAEAKRYIQECLLVSLYITDVSVSDLALRDSKLTATITMSTIYGKEEMFNV